MITVAELRKKARNRYRDVLKEMLRGNDPFPLTIRYPRLRTTGERQELVRGIQAIKSQSRESLGFGFTVEWVEVETRKFGRNLIPGEIGFAGAGDFFGYLGKQAEAAEILDAAARIRARYPAAEWPVGNFRFLSGRKAGFWEDVFEVVDFLQENPFPDLFARELPVRVPTKFVEENEAVIESLLRAVAPESWRAEGVTFAERLGLRSPESLIEIRFLDPEVAPDLPLTHFTAAASQLRAEVFEGISRVLITENRLTFLTLPPLPGTLAILGHGYAISRLKRLPWLADRELFYWGDIDAEGFEILATLRRIFPHAESLLMDREIWHSHREYLNAGSGKTVLSESLISLLTADELELAKSVAAENLRLEQERILPEVFVPALREIAMCIQ